MSMIMDNFRIVSIKNALTAKTILDRYGVPKQQTWRTFLTRTF